MFSQKLTIFEEITILHLHFIKRWTVSMKNEDQFLIILNFIFTCYWNYSTVLTHQIHVGNSVLNLVPCLAGWKGEQSPQTTCACHLCRQNPETHCSRESMELSPNKAGTDGKAGGGRLLIQSMWPKAESSQKASLTCFSASLIAFFQW